MQREEHFVPDSPAIQREIAEMEAELRAREPESFTLLPCKNCGGYHFEMDHNIRDMFAEFGAPASVVETLGHDLRREYVPDQRGTPGGRPPQALTPDEKRAKNAEYQRRWRERQRQQKSYDL